MIAHKLSLNAIRQIRIFLKAFSEKTLVVPVVERILIEVHVNLTEIISVVLEETIVEASVFKLGSPSFPMIMQFHHMLG